MVSLGVFERSGETMFRTAHWLLTLIVIVTAAYSNPAPAPQPGRSHELGEPIRVDEDVTIELIIRPVGASIELHWLPKPDVMEWFIVRAFDPNLADAETLLATTATTWTDDNILLQNHTTAFYWVIPRYPLAPPHDEDIVEDFDYNPVFTSYSDQDAEPDSFQLVSGGALLPNGHVLELDGNTWKQETISPMRVVDGTIWRMAIKLFGRGEHQAFGMADSANEMWYSWAGWEERNSEAWIQTYQGWFEDSTWQWVELCIGGDWYSHFGYFPSISKLMFANDNDADTSACSWQVDEIRDITGAISYPPVAGFSWEIIDRPSPDSMDVRFYPYSYDPDDSLAFIRWDFGDSTFASESHPVHRYRSQRSYAAVEMVADSNGRMDWAMQHVEDTTSFSSHQMTLLCTGDVMMARRYEDDGGIIQTWGVDSIFGRARPLLSSVDFATCNLECPLTSDTNHHPTKLYYFKGRPEYVEGLDFAGFDYVNLANNHTFDYMLPGQHETIHVLDSVGILNGGADDDENQAREPVFFSQNGVCIAMLGFCNRDGTEDNAQPYLAAGPSRPGFAMWDRAAIEEMLPRVRAVADVVIVQVHSGIEYAIEPPALGMPQDLTGWDDDGPVLELLPDTSDVALRKFAIDMGADLVINHHPHVIQGCEVYNGKVIAHSTGNFAFDQTFPETFLSFALESRLSLAHGVDSFVVHPIYIDRYIPTPASGELAGAILDYESELSRPMGTWMVREPDGETATILLDTNVTRSFAEFTDTLTLGDLDTLAESAPFKLQGGGYPTEITVISPPEAEVRMGRDVVMFGNMEDEGSNQWDLNSNYEHFDPQHYRGQRSIRLNRAGGGTNSVSTRFLFRRLYHPEHAGTICGWVHGVNTRDAKMQFEFWNGRTGGDNLGLWTPGGVFQGDFPWTYVWQDLEWPQDGWCYNVSLNLRAPVIGEGQAWFDDIALVEWEGWHPESVQPGFPNNLTFLQARAPLGTTQVIITYRREWVNTP
jgi:hypothetical protein